MQALINTFVTRFAVIDKTTAKELVTVVGLISFFVLIVVSGLLGAFAPTPDLAIDFMVTSVVVAIVTGVVGREYFFAN